MSVRCLLMALLLAASAGCATTAADPRDPLEGFNRAMYSVNDGLDVALFKPVARAYRAVLPGAVRDMVRSFFSNIDDLYIAVNNLLQGKGEDAAGDLMRFAMNTTFGLFGILDWASDMGLEKHNEDFGQTLGTWGVGNGPYLVLPFFGPHTLRDAAALPLDWEADPVVNHTPVGERNALSVARVISRRADLLDASRMLDDAALDKYVFLREAYLQRRRSLIYDGNPPRETRPTQ